jgi:hypothetical protein
LRPQEARLRSATLKSVKLVGTFMLFYSSR